VELTQVHRQRDTQFAAMLNELRRGYVSPEGERMLVACTRNDFFAVESTISDAPRGTDGLLASRAEALVEPTRLYSTNKDVDELNLQRLSALPGKGVCLSIVSPHTWLQPCGLKTSLRVDAREALSSI
jgi:hypothetical protein